MNIKSNKPNLILIYINNPVMERTVKLMTKNAFLIVYGLTAKFAKNYAKFAMIIFI